MIFAEYVTCWFNGQLGNQLFQIAAAVGYALDHNCEAIFPGAPSALNGTLNCQYVLHRLNTAPTPEGVEFQPLKELIHSNIYKELPFQPGRDTILQGHFESERYFERHRQVIQELFAHTQEILDTIHEKYGDLLAEPMTVALHVRTFIPDGRDPIRVGIGGARWRYFTAAMQYFPPNAHYLVFSDNTEWTKNHLPTMGRKVTFIEGNPHYIDFYLMSLCHHQIISPESTFSWWAAWLNRNPNKTIIVADVWNDTLNNDTIPEGWIKLPKNPPYVFPARHP